MPKKTKKNRKYGRGKKASAQYVSEGRFEKNKARRIARHLKNNPNAAR